MPGQKNELDDLVDGLVESIDKTSTEMVGEQQSPFASQPLTRDEQLARYLEIRDDPANWAKLLEEEGLKDTISYATSMESLLKGKGGTNASTE
jgi:hypothetical protein